MWMQHRFQVNVCEQSDSTCSNSTELRGVWNGFTATQHIVQILYRWFSKQKHVCDLHRPSSRGLWLWREGPRAERRNCAISQTSDCLCVQHSLYSFLRLPTFWHHFATFETFWDVLHADDYFYQFDRPNLLQSSLGAWRMWRHGSAWIVSDRISLFLEMSHCGRDMKSNLPSPISISSCSFEGDSIMLVIILIIMLVSWPSVVSRIRGVRDIANIQHGIVMSCWHYSCTFHV